MLQHHWNFTIRLFSVIWRTRIGRGSYPFAEVQSVYSTAPAHWTSFYFLNIFFIYFPNLWDHSAGYCINVMMIIKQFCFGFFFPVRPISNRGDILWSIRSLNLVISTFGNSWNSKSLNIARRIIHWFGLVWFYGISTIVGYWWPIHFYTNKRLYFTQIRLPVSMSKSVLFQTIQFSVSKSVIFQKIQLADKNNSISSNSV